MKDIQDVTSQHNSDKQRNCLEHCLEPCSAAWTIMAAQLEAVQRQSHLSPCEVCRQDDLREVQPT